MIVVINIIYVRELDIGIRFLYEQLMVKVLVASQLTFDTEFYSLSFKRSLMSPLAPQGRQGAMTYREVLNSRCQG
jgi:hypothetical protein